MKIIALTGPHNCGKTTTIISVYDIIIRFGGVSTAKGKEGLDPRDFSDIVIWRGLNIAFLSMGDLSRRISSRINHFNNAGCDIFITACNDRLATAQRNINNYRDKHIVNKTHEPDCAKRAAADQEAVFKILRALKMDVCYFASLFAENTYVYLSRVFKHRLGIAETGITDVFAFELADLCRRTGNTSVRMYAKTWPVESVYGNDIDLFMQRPDGLYNLFVLQAKKMSFNGAYKDLKLEAAPNQWDKLLTHETLYGSKAFYLFYNGESVIAPITTNPVRADCLGVPKLQELGLGIVEAATVKQVREVTHATGAIYMSYLFPDHMDSVRKLICCGDTLYTGLQGYSHNQIYTGAPYRPVQVANNAQQGQDEDEGQDVVPEDHNDMARFRIIISASHEE